MIHGHPYKLTPRRDKQPRALRAVWVLILCMAAYALVFDDRADAAPRAPGSCTEEASYVAR